MKNTGIPYELLTKRIFQDILDQSDVKTIKVEHNVILQGKAANHQIDVYWKFELNGIEYETVVQAKDWNQTVNQGELLKFKAVLDDLPGSPVGIFVTRTGYQSGASDYAKSQGIKLYELREPTDNDFEGRIKEIHVRMNFRIPQVSQEQPVLDVEWAKAEKKRHNLSDEDLTVQLGGMANEIYFKDSKGNPKLSFHDASNQLVDQATADANAEAAADETERQTVRDMLPALAALSVPGAMTNAEQSQAIHQLARAVRRLIRDSI